MRHGSGVTDGRSCSGTSARSCSEGLPPPTTTTLILKIQRRGVYEQSAAKAISYRVTVAWYAHAYIDDARTQRDNEIVAMEGLVMSMLRAVVVSGGALAAIVVEAIASCLWVESCWEQFQSAAPAFGLP